MNPRDSEFLRHLAAIEEPHFAQVRRFLESAGFSLPAEGTQARAWCEVRARGGDTEAQYALAEMMSIGLFGSISSLEAFRWCKRAAAQGHPGAILLLAQMFFVGGTDSGADEFEAKRHAEEAAERGFLPALHYLALMILTENRSKAISLLRSAAEKGYGPALSLLADELIEEGNIEEGIELMLRAADAEDVHAHRMLSHFYRAGRYGLPVDYRKSDFHDAAASEIEAKRVAGLNLN